MLSFRRLQSSRHCARRCGISHRRCDTSFARSHTRPAGKALETVPSIDSRESSSTVELASSLHCDRGAKGCMLAQLLHGGLEMSQPHEGIRIVELSQTLAGRLVGLLFADQEAEVLLERPSDHEPDEHDEYFDRGKVAVPPGSLGDSGSADVVIVDGDAEAAWA